jgi:hypothetical protein
MGYMDGSPPTISWWPNICEKEISGICSGILLSGVSMLFGVRKEKS